MFSLLLIAATGFGTNLEVKTDCPAARDIQMYLAPLSRDSPPQPHLHAMIWRSGSDLVVELHREEGALLATRHLTTAASCDELARAAAIVITAWEQQFQTTPVELAFLPAGTTRPAPRHGAAWEIGSGLVGSFTTTEFALGALVDAAVAPRHWWALRLTLRGTDTRQEPLGVGHASWTRLVVGAGPVYRSARSPVRIDFSIQALAGLLFISGSGFSTTRDDTTLEPGIRGAVRLGLTEWTARPWIEASIDGWPQSQRGHVQESADVAVLPHLEVLMIAGISVGSWR
jgi:hypothetical protein